MKRIVSSLVLTAATFGLALAPAIAQQQSWNGYGQYNNWQPGWNSGHYNRRHIIIGTVVSFSPYRLTIARANGNQTVDLKGGTVIRPTGATPQPGEHVAMIGYYSHGTFIVHRLVVRP